MFRLLLSLLLIGLPSMAVRASDLPKVVSLNMCADPYLMAFAAPEQILALSSLSRDPALSPFHQAAKHYPVTFGGLEDILALQPDIVIVSPYSSPMKQSLLKQYGIRVVAMASSQNFASAGEEILALGAAIGQATKAASYWQDLQAQLQAVSRGARGLTVLPLQRRGLTVGDEHILWQVMQLAGATPANVLDTKTEALAPLNLEQAIGSKADAILMSAPIGLPSDRGVEFLTHPALKHRFPEDRRLYLDSRLTTCSGAATPLAVAQLAEALAKINGTSR